MRQPPDSNATGTRQDTVASEVKLADTDKCNMINEYDKCINDKEKIQNIDAVFLSFIVFEDKNTQSQWKNLVKEWLDYKKDIKDSYKSSKSIEAFYKKLYSMSGGELSIAHEIVENSIANGYKGIFEIKKNNFQPSKNPQSRSEQIKQTMMRVFPEEFEDMNNAKEKEMKDVNPLNDAGEDFQKDVNPLNDVKLLDDFINNNDETYAK
jgi:hypothetical protein